MLIEIIDRPISGQYFEIHFGETSSNCLWVKFTDNANDIWVGSFEQGLVLNKTIIHSLEKQNKAFVIASGKGYLIDVVNKQSLNKKEILHIKCAILNEDQTNIYFSNGFNVQSIDLNGTLTVLLDEYYFDEIELLKVMDKTLHAKYWYYQRTKEPFHLEIDLDTIEIKDSYYNDSSQ